ncbi:MAG TPA: efflux RND transporter periplasmic adaptor subunit [Anaerolineales bacterium]|nr:efflux RND transporter periplasmic adaptor subunit [Anaerolineales bacterium]HMV94835.1 efflux RND transporter periplasmic adaptor subunit [Anaerolineales bacterium]HMX17863.1 efflux RND transporter periplasmic adaptor subunit [Anaerolineales bacterium]HMX72817.1 efflux RND transporter periplasmic adaptor subunit [Anaerolineales bacterium]HMZ43882.1 efflux RND transporter periplasmic adaptor subunit [Anaerolineales bacterium]
MRKTLLIVFVILATALTACGGQATPEAVPTISLDAPSQSSGGSATASAVVVPVTKVELSFPLSGAVKTVEVAEGDSVTAGQPLVTLDTAILEARVAEAEANVVTVTTQLTYLKRTGTSQERLDAAQANIDRAMAAVEIAKAQLSQATLVAPFDGTIASVEISPAEFASPGQIIIVMGDLTHFQIETTDFSEKDIPSVSIGQAAQVFIEALDQEFTGKVVDIARSSETVGGDVVFKVTIQLDEQPDGLRWGMSADVKIEEK